MKHIELFNNGFDLTVQKKIQPENWPYVGYSPNDGFMFTMVPEPPQMIDLGLPSGLKWADRNVGAYSPDDAGLYFSWGNVDGHPVDKDGNIMDGYSFSESIYYNTPGYKYNGNTLDAAHDAATVNIGNGWRMPTIEEITELVENTDHYYINEDGDKSNFDKEDINLRSICFVKKGDTFNYEDRSNFIEIPFASFCFNTLLHGDYICVFVWSSSIYKRANGYFLCVDNMGDIHYEADGTRGYFGFSVRGVHA